MRQKSLPLPLPLLENQAKRYLPFLYVSGFVYRLFLLCTFECAWVRGYEQGVKRRYPKIYSFNGESLSVHISAITPFLAHVSADLKFKNSSIMHGSDEYDTKKKKRLEKCNNACYSGNHSNLCL